MNEQPDKNLYGLQIISNIFHQVDNDVIIGLWVMMKEW